MSAAADRTERPGTVDTAFKFLLVAIGVDAVMWVLGTFFVSPSGFAEMREEMGQGAARQVAMSAGFLVVTSALLLLLAFKMREGHGWARTGFVVVGVLGILFFVGTMDMNGVSQEATNGIFYDLAGRAPSILTLGAILLMFLPVSNSYFAATKRAGQRRATNG